MPASKKEEIRFEEAFQKLEAIVVALERGESTLDEAMKAFEEGMKLVETCLQKLNAAEVRLQRLVNGKNGEFRTEPME